ncbi:MAG: carboxypeptidase-like regulatory domain-containing protein [Pyrinomonadaceae bacterium]|nr:carboxypeptidase-like regulatory domain-containing protein [Pyrinomonadaceae bacterium]
MLKRTLTIQMLFILMVVLSTALAATAQINKSRTYMQKSEVMLNEAADLDQCANGPLGTPVPCEAKAWVNGNLNHNQAHFLEGESVPYRLRFSGLQQGSTYTVTIEWDTTENSAAKHALDYLTTYNRSETDADPCTDVAGCNPMVYTTWAIPLDPLVAAGNDGVLGTADDIVQEPGDFTLFGSILQGVSAYTVTGTYDSASQTRITLTFLATSTDPILAWGGHISTRYDWGFDHSAIAIPGASYHMRLLDLNGAGGNQDRSLSNSAAIFPGRITIIKDAVPNTIFPFVFTATGPGVSNFTLDDDGLPLVNYPNTITFGNLIYFGTENQTTFTETPYPGFFTLSDVLCTSDANGGSGTNNNIVDLEALRLTVNLEEGESVTCTFVNAITGPTAAEVTVGGRITDETGMPVRNALITFQAGNGSEVYYARSNGFGYYTLTAIPVGEMYVMTPQAKGYRFDPPVIAVQVQDTITGLDLIAIRDP